MIDADERPLRQSAEQTQRIWDRVATGIAAERRRFRRNALVAAFAGGLIGAALLGALLGREEGPGEDKEPAPAAACEANPEALAIAGCP